MACGIVVVDKPSGWTSQDVAAKLRGVFHEQRVGHGGTLDPMATGVLPIFVGRATRAVEYFTAEKKEYYARLRLGVVTTTQDITGEVLETRPVSLKPGELEEVLKRFTGKQLQTPPMYSAVKINGRRLYQLAREGKEIERPPRSVYIHSIALMPEEDAEEGADPLLRVRCSKGTYIRSLCHDIGQALGCGGCMSSLRRTAAGQFWLKDSIPLARLIDAPHPEDFLLTLDTLFLRLPILKLDAKQEARCRCGTPAPCPGKPSGRYRVYGEDGTFLMVGRLHNGTLRTEKNFF